MADMLSDAQRAALERLAQDLERVFAGRLESLVSYAGHQGDETLHTLALVKGLGFKDLSACVPLVDGWRRARLAVPLMLSHDELQRTIDIFPLEYASIIASAVVIRGANPFAGVEVPIADVRRACETQAKSHLIHLREGFLEARGDTAAIGSLITSSGAPFRTLLTNILRLPERGGDSFGPALFSDESLATGAEARIGVPRALVREVLGAAHTGQTSIADPSALLARYIDAAGRIWEYVDGWKAE